MKYFKNIENEEQAKKLYRKLALKLHPDKGGDPNEFILLQNEYSELLEQLGQSPAFKEETKQPDNTILDELKFLGKTFLKSKATQDFLRTKAQNSRTPYESLFYKEILDLIKKNS